MKKYLVIGNPINHSLSPKLHNFWIKKNNISATYEKKQINVTDIKDLILRIKNNQINGANVTVPFKKSVIPFLDKLTEVAKETQSVNIIHKDNNKVVGDNTDVYGFSSALKDISYIVKNKKIIILGAGGVVTSIVIALKKMGASHIILSNRTKKKAEELKKIYSDLNVVNWGELPDFDMIINATSLGLKKNDKINLNYSEIGPNKFFYDVIYNPKETHFLSMAKKFSNTIENGKKMFAYQAQLSFEIWHGIKPVVDKQVLQLLEND